MLIDYEYKNGSLCLSHFDKNGDVKIRQYKWSNPMNYEEAHPDDIDKHPIYQSWWGAPVKGVPTRYPNKYSVYDFIDSLPQKEQDILYDYNDPNMFFIDIETEITDAKLQPQLAPSKVLSISIVNKDEVIVMGIDKLTEQEIKEIGEDINEEYGKLFNKKYRFRYKYYRTEYEMMFSFFNHYVPKMAVLTGWNFVGPKAFDWIFLVNRARKLGIDPSVSSLTKKLNPSNPNNEEDFSELPAHRLVIDYMSIFDKWDQSISVKESRGLDFVAEKVLGIKKVHYEGGLKYLYETDKKKFLYYNAVDSILVQMIHEKSKTADILFSVSNLSRITVKSGVSTIAVTEGVMRKEMRDRKNIILIKTDKEGSKVVGGWVKDPVTGMSSYTCCFDFASLYPTTMRQFNISSDSYKGQKIKGINYALFNGRQVELEETDIVTYSGAVFRNEVGVMNIVLSNIYADRKKYKHMMQDEHENLENLKKELKELEALM